MSGNIIGVSDHGGWAIFVTMGREGTLLDRRRVELVDDNLPAIPHHHEAQMLPVDQGVPIIEGIALRARQPLPPTIAERLKDVRARNVADWIMYRNALASAAEARGWSVHWIEPKNLDLNAKQLDLRKKVGPPWSADHKLAMALALEAQPS